MSEFALLMAGSAIVLVIATVWLVRSAMRPATEAIDPDAMVWLADATDELAAKVLASKVEAFGIRTFVRNRLGPILYGFPPSFIGWEVLVREGDFEEARALIGAELVEDPQDA